MAWLVPANWKIGEPCRPGRDRRDKPGDDEWVATIFAPVTFVAAAQPDLIRDYRSGRALTKDVARFSHTQDTPGIFARCSTA
jgi:hypothetical protein